MRFIFAEKYYHVARDEKKIEIESFQAAAQITDSGLPPIHSKIWFPETANHFQFSPKK